MNKKIDKKTLIYIMALCLIIGLCIGLTIGINRGAEAQTKKCEETIKTIQETQPTHNITITNSPQKEEIEVEK